MAVQPYSATAPIKALAGTEASPGITFTGGDTDTGVYSPAANQFGVTTGGTSKLIIDENGSLQVVGGTKDNPAIYFDEGTGIYSPGADQVAISTNGTGRLFVDANGNVGLGTSSPLAPAHFAYSVTGSDGDSKGVILSLVNTATAVAGAGSSVSFGCNLSTSGSSSFAINIASIEGIKENGIDGNFASALKFVTRAHAGSPTERMRITSDAYVRLASGTGGIQFNGDTAATNALDDYEEGTWTPALAFGGGSTAITYNARAGYYIKIGKQVFLTLYFNLSSKGTDTGDATITGLPFISEDFNIGGTTSWPGNRPSRRQNETSIDFAMMVADNTATIICTNGAGISVTDTAFTNGTIIECSLSYRAA